MTERFKRLMIYLREIRTVLGHIEEEFDKEDLIASALIGSVKYFLDKIEERAKI
jgi:hypothetical protein